jgi:threonine 3-dehydrogenase
MIQSGLDIGPVITHRFHYTEFQKAFDVMRSGQSGKVVANQPLEEALKPLGMKEGFDVGMEMSGNPVAFDSMLANMCHGGKIAMLGILPKTAIDWDTVVFNGLTIKGIYGREMYETWYKMTSMIQSGLDIGPVITHQFHYTEFQKAFEVMRSGQSGKVVLDWTEKK